MRHFIHSVLFIAALNPIHAADTFLVENGQPLAEIVIAEKPARMTKLAAKELQSTIAKMSGATLPVVTERTAGNDDDLVRDMSGNRSLVLFDSGDEVVVRAGEQGIRFLLVSGAPIKEPVAWYGPIVMNTQAELQVAMRDLRDGTFIKH